MRTLFCLALITMWITDISGQYKINGTITTEVDINSPVIGATVVLEGIDKGTITDINGKYEFTDIEKGSYILKINSVGFTSKNIEIVVSEDQEFHFTLSEKIFDLPNVVVESITMTGGLSGVSKSLGSAHFIGQKEIQKFSYTDINRTLRSIPGTNIQEEDGYGLRPNIGLRATGSERSSKITIMEDGILAAPAPYAAPAAYYFPSVGRMEAIEILKGSSQIKYGPYTTGGAINLISTPIPSGFSGHADLIAGSDTYRMLHANLGNAHKNVSYLVETLRYEADGFKQLDNGGKTGFNKEDYMAKFRIHTNPDAPVYQSVTFKIGKATETAQETYLGLTNEDFQRTPLRRYAGSQKDVINTTQHQYSITHFAQLTSFLDIHSSLYRTEFSRNWYKLDKVNGQKISSILDVPENYAAELSTIKGASNSLIGMDVKANNRSYYGRGLQTNLIFHLSQGTVSHKLDLGIRIHQDQIDRFQWVDIYNMADGIMSLSRSGVPGTESNRVSTANATATYLQYKLTKDRLILTTGLRHEHIAIDRQDYGKEDPQRLETNLKTRENRVDVFIPGIAASYQISGSQNIFGGIHKGFAPPGAKEGTDPEASWNYELGWRHHKKPLKVQILGYLNDYSNLLGADLAASGGGGTQDLFNGGGAIAHGIEAELTYILSSKSNYRLPVSLAYTFSKAHFTSSFDSEFEGWGSVVSGDLLPYVPMHQLAANFSIEHNKYLFDINTKYSSAMLTRAGSSENTDSPRTDDAFIIDIAFNYRISKNFSAFVNLNNVADNIYVVASRPAGLRPNQPRTFKTGLKVNF